MEGGQEKLYAPEQISGMVLEELKRVASQHFASGGETLDTVITVPAYFNDDQRQVLFCRDHVSRAASSQWQSKLATLRHLPHCARLLQTTTTRIRKLTAKSSVLDFALTR